MSAHPRLFLAIVLGLFSVAVQAADEDLRAWVYTLM